MAARWLIGLIVVLSFGAAALWIGARPEERVGHVRVLAINDLHGALAPTRDPSNEARLVGGVAALKAAMDTAEARCECLAVRVDAGDQMHGTLTSNLSYGAATVAALNLIGIDAAAIGNHDLDWSVDTLRARMEEAEYPWLAANVFDSATGLRPGWARPYHVVDYPGLRVAYVGMITSRAKQIVYAPRVAGLSFGSGRAALADVLAEVRAQDPDLTILTAHVGGGCASGTCFGEIVSLAEELDPADVDLIVAGHAHLTMTTEVNGIPIVQAGANGLTLGIVDLYRRDRGGWQAEVAVHRVLVDEVTPDIQLQELVAAFSRTAEPLADRPIATLSSALRSREELGNLIADAQRQVAEADVALMNAGGVRGSLPAGAVTYDMLYRVMPFDNQLVRLTISGSELRGIIEQTLGRVSLAGVQVTLSSRSASGSRIAGILVGGRPIVDGDSYTLALSNFLAEGAEGLDALTGLPRDDVGVTTLDALISHLQAAPQPFVIPTNPRVVITN